MESSGSRTEHLVSDVEMARMLMPRSASVSNILARCPRWIACRCRPRDLHDVRVGHELIEADRLFGFELRGGESERRAGNGEGHRSGTGAGAALHDHVDVDVRAREGAKIAATVPNLSGRPVRVTRASFLWRAMP